MATISKSLTISAAGSYDLDISLWTAIINVSTSSSEFYGHSVSVTTPTGTDTVSFSSTGAISYKVHDAGTYTFSITYAGTTYTTSVEVTDETTYTTTLNLWQATVNISTTSSEFYGGTITITSSVLSTADTVTFSSSGSATYVAGKAGTYNFAISYGGKTYQKELEITSQTTYSLTLNTLEIVGWKNATDEQIVAMIQALDAGDISASDLPWAVGDERTINLNAISAGTYNAAHAAQSATLVIMNVGAYNGTGHYVVGLKNSLKETEKMEESNTNANGWHGSRGKKCCDAIFNMIPSSINSIFKEFTVYSGTKGGTDSPGITAASGKLSLFAEKEIFGTKTYSTQSEISDSRISKIKYYETTANRIKKLGDDGSANGWWERSPYCNNTNYFCLVTANGAADYYNATNSFGFAPFGVI